MPVSAGSKTIIPAALPIARENPGFPCPGGCGDRFFQQAPAATVTFRPLPHLHSPLHPLSGTSSAAISSLSQPFSLFDKAFSRPQALQFNPHPPAATGQNRLRVGFFALLPQGASL